MIKLKGLITENEMYRDVLGLVQFATQHYQFHDGSRDKHIEKMIKKFPDARYKGRGYRALVMDVRDKTEQEVKQEIIEKDKGNYQSWTSNQLGVHYYIDKHLNVSLYKKAVIIRSNNLDGIKLDDVISKLRPDMQEKLFTNYPYLAQELDETDEIISKLPNRFEIINM